MRGQGDVETDRTAPFKDSIQNPADLFNEARDRQTASVAVDEDGTPAGDPPPNYLQILKDARPRLTQYYIEHMQAPIDASYRAFRSKHFNGSKYWHTDYKHRSKLFRPKTRTAVRKAGASAVSALFATADSVKCSPGDESDPKQQANAKLLQELFNYRTDRTSGMAAMPWFRICGGAHQDAMITSACVSKQYWKQELRKTGERTEADPKTGEHTVTEDWEPFIDRPDVMLFPLENIEIDPAAYWLNPIQSASVFVAKMPMTVDEVMSMTKHPLNPWNDIGEAALRSMATTSDQAAKAARQSREGSTDRLDSRFSGRGAFEIVWVFEVFIRYQGQDVCFWAAQDKAYLTEPKPVKEVYPEQGGERPYTFGVVNLESHRLFPMSPVESWQQSQIEINEFANLTLDTAKLAVAPVTKVKRGANVDLNQLSRRGPNSQILVDDEKDVTWEKEPGPDASAFQIMERLNNDFDTAAGNFDQSTVQSSGYTGKTVGGLQLIAGATNAVAEFDQRVWIETWVEPTIAQVLKLIQYYEQDETILGICGKRAQLLEKFKVSVIDDHLLQQQVTVRVDAGVGNADPMQRLQKLQQVIGVLMPLFKDNPKVASGEIQIDIKAISDEAWGLGGWNDGDRFVKLGQPQQNPHMGLEMAKLQAEIEKNKKQGSAAIITALSAAAKVDLGQRQIEDQRVNDELDHHLQATDMGHSHGLALRQHTEGRADNRAAATHSQGMAEKNFDASREDAAAAQAAAAAEGGEGGSSSAAAPAPAPESDEPEPQQADPTVQMLGQLMQLLTQPRRFKIVRGPDNRITEIDQTLGDEDPPPQQQGAPPPPAPTDTAQPPSPGGFVV